MVCDIIKSILTPNLKTLINQTLTNTEGHKLQSKSEKLSTVMSL